jgi:putative Mg2+ transporter-C (MgtC) family protein
MTLTEALTALVVATLLGGLIGVQRQAVRKPAGLRTHALVALGACLFAVLSSKLNDTRIAAGIISGIGFLGAGAIVRNGPATSGLTTAASIWVTAAIGMTVGFDEPYSYPIALATTAIAFALLVASDRWPELVPIRRTLNVALTFDLDVLPMEQMFALVAARAGTIRRREAVTVVHEPGGRRVATVSIGLVMGAKDSVDRLFDAISRAGGIEKIAVTDETAEG